ncbi:Hsp70 family protein [Streptomyces sp. Je 1-369]|uniref:Hsp70 family protein n=1 Tax=Streptomyces sp. Je 1-369 TaxID=2966192 RepID=UPI0022860212|nr:Hsp70 family protein [Streptomyces sp. Je 1-369]WAL98540.1 Hsp70 family protein [Streptomyces sp. Je 1-369]
MTQARPVREAPAPVSLGIDFGATGIRALYAPPDGPGRRLDAEWGDGPWLLCEQADTGELPVTFPSLKSRLGSGRPVHVGGKPVDADRVVVQLLRSVRERVEAAARGRVAQTVISVPARFGSAQRAALRDAAREAGLDPTRLVSDSMAAVIGHMTERDSGTCLIYGMGYEGFEIGLVRSVRGHFRSLGYEGGATSGGRAFDAEALSSAVRLLRRHRGAGSVHGVDAAVWQGLRARGQEAREALGVPDGPEAAVLDLELGAGPALWVRFARPDLDAYLERHVGRTLDRARALLDQSGMTPTDVDTLLLVGGNTRMEQVRSRVSALIGGETVQAPPELLALGALKHAVRLAGGAASSGPAALEEGPLEPAAATHDTLSDAPPLTATLVGAEGQGAGARDVEGARRLVREGREEEAAAVLRGIIAEARELLDGLTRRGTPERPVPSGPVAGPGRGPGRGPGPVAGSGPGPGSFPAPGSAPGPGSFPAPGSGSGSFPGPGPGSGSGSFPGSGPGSAPGSGSGSGSGPTPASGPGPGPGSGSGPTPASGPASGPGPGPASASASGQRLSSSAPGPSTGHAPPPATSPARAPAPVFDYTSQRQIARARALLSLGRYDHAVQASHIAWQDAATRPAGADMLDAMIDVHCAAAMADMAPEHFADAEQWLNCAYNHDPTNVRVRGLLAERTFRHAVELDRRGERDEAIEALGKCLTWDPEHAEADALLRRLNRGGRNRRGRGDVLGQRSLEPPP